MGKSTKVDLGRRRNARGEGSKLADEIVDGTLRLIERSGSDAAVTLRSVAKEVGIAAPSIYAHFKDREAILWAVVVRSFDELADRIEAARLGVSDPVEQLLAGCEAYVDFGLEEPGRYRAVFAREFPSQFTEQLAAHMAASAAVSATSGLPHPMLDDRLPPVGTEAFALLVDGIERCIEEGVSRSTDPFRDATAIWVGLHGMISLWSTMCEFPWPERHELVRHLVLCLAQVDEPSTSKSRLLRS